MYGIIITQMGDVSDRVQLTNGTSLSIEDYLAVVFGYHYSFRWAVVGILLGFTGLFLALALTALKCLNYQTR